VLRRLPASMNSKEVLFLDGIRHAAEISSLAYSRLQTTLTHIATAVPKEEEADALYCAAFLDAWAVVDAIDRFRALWTLLPIPVRSEPADGNPNFTTISQPVRDLRNVADHLAQRADYVIAQRGSALGVLSWFTVTDAAKVEGLSCVIVPGTLRLGTSEVSMVNPAGKAIELPTGLIHLAAGGYSACLSDVIPAMALRVAQLEQALEATFVQLGVTSSIARADLLITALMGAMNPKADTGSHSADT